MGGVLSTPLTSSAQLIKPSRKVCTSLKTPKQLLPLLGNVFVFFFSTLHTLLSEADVFYTPLLHASVCPTVRSSLAQGIVFVGMSDTLTNLRAFRLGAVVYAALEHQC